MSENALINKYRPQEFDQVVGHASILPALERAMAADTRPHAYLFSGPGGLGKTTLARIVARTLGCDMIEIDAATNNGIDAAKQIVEAGNHMSLMGGGHRAFIIDECHALTRPAWQALLKLLEEPPAHLFIMLCTTELAKVPDTIKMRCYHVALRPLSSDDLGDLLDAIASLEGWEVAPDVMQAVIEAGTGQPRKAISILQSVWDAPSRDEVRRIINLMTEGDAVYDLCQALARGQAWDQVQRALGKIEDAEFDNASIAIGRYMTAAMVRSKTEKDAMRFWRILDALVFPSETYDRKTAFHAAIGRILWGAG